MSYCVQCGVRLAQQEKKCPLCGTPVINPNPQETKEDHLYPDEYQKMIKTDKPEVPCDIFFRGRVDFIRHFRTGRSVF